MIRKTIVHINTFNIGSTGTIMKGICKFADFSGYNVFMAYPDSRTNRKLKEDKDIIIGNWIQRNIDLKLAYLTGMDGRLCRKSTKDLINKIDLLNPSIIHLHNLHNSYINLKLLFKYLKKKNIKVVWTLHDCWAFTGQCTHFVSIGCEKWKSGCYNCKNFRNYPSTLYDKSKSMYLFKKHIFNSLKDMVLVTPSFWLKNEVEKSFLNKYRIKVIYNGIDLNIFKPTKSNFRKNNNLINKKIILGVAYSWNKKKGLDIFLKLAKMLDESYKIVLVGLNDIQIKDMPKNIIALPKTKTVTELVEIYSTADLFINPSLQETMSLVTVEALACGTPVIVSNNTALPELVDSKSGIIVNDCTADGFFKEIKKYDYSLKESDCLQRAKAFDINKNFNEYINIYNRLIDKNDI